MYPRSDFKKRFGLVLSDKFSSPIGGHWAGKNGGEIEPNKVEKSGISLVKKMGSFSYQHIIASLLY